MFAKLIFFIIICFLIYYFIFPKLKFDKKTQNDKKVENFVECARCGVYLNINETIIKDGKYYCDECIKRKD